MRSRIIGLAVLAAAFAIAVFGIPLAIGIWQFALADERTALQRAADAAALAVASEVYDNDPITTLPRVEGLRLAVYDHHSERLAGIGPPDDPNIQQALAGVTLAGTQGDELIIAVPVTHESDITGAVRATVSTPVSSSESKSPGWECWRWPAWPSGRCGSSPAGKHDVSPAHSKTSPVPPSDSAMAISACAPDRRRYPRSTPSEAR